MSARRVLFLGCGVATRSHSRVLRRRRGVELYYASRDAGRAEACARQFRGQSFDSYADALTRDVDLVVVATPPSLHFELSLLALGAGKHVVIEKPAFMRSRDCEAVRAAAKDCGRRVLVAENYAYKPIVGTIIETVRSGDLGDVRFVHVNATKSQRVVGWRADAGLGGHPLLEGGIHWMTFMASLGIEIATVEGRPAGSDRSTLVTFGYENGAIGTLLHSWELAAPLGGLRLSKIQGTKGAITLESNGFAAAISGRRPAFHMPAFLDPTGTRAMWDDFLWSLETGAESRYTLDMAQRDLRHVEQALGIAPELLDSNDLDVEDEGGVRRNGALRLRSVSV